MLKKPCFILTILLSSMVLAKEVVITSPATQVLPNPSSQQAWQSLPNKIDPQWLDHFIATYPRAVATPVAFTLRYQVLQGIREVQGIDAVPIYHAFISKYPHTLATHRAKQELLQLYRQQHEKAGKDTSKLEPVLASYLDFMYRYSDSTLALVAKAAAEQIAFEQVVAANEIEEYEAFMQLFPTAPQVPAAEKLAKAKDVATEREYLQVKLGKLKKRLKYFEHKLAKLESTPNTTEENIQRLKRRLENTIRGLKGPQGQITNRKDERARQLCLNLGKLVESAEFLSDNSSISEEKQAQLFQNLRQYERLSHVIRKFYFQQTAAGCVREENRHQQLIAKLDDIKNTIKTESERLIGVIQEEFTNTRKILTTGFEQLHQDNQQAQKSLQALLKGVDKLHGDLQEVNGNLRQIHQDVVDVRLTIEQSNKHLATLHEDLEKVDNQIVQLNEDMNRGMAAQQKLLGEVVNELGSGFNTLDNDMKAAMSQKEALHRKEMQVESKQTQLLEKQVQSTQALVKSQHAITTAINKQTEMSVYNTERLVKSNRRTQTLIQKQGQTMMKYAKKSGGSSSSGDGGLLGTVMSAVSSFL